MVTTTWVLVEVADALSVPGFRRHVHRSLDRVSGDPNTRLVTADAAWYARGLALYRARPDKVLVPHGLHQFRGDDSLSDD